MSSNLRSSEVCDALDALGMYPKIVEPSLVAMSGDAVVNGPAYTLLVTPALVGSLGATNLRTAIEATPVGAVLVIDASAVRFAIWGGLMTAAALEREVCGLVCAGLVRDVSEASVRIPIFASGVCPLRAASRFGIVVTRQPVAIGGVVIEAGDHVYADRDGIVVVAALHATAVAAAAQEVRAREVALTSTAAPGAAGCGWDGLKPSARSSHTKLLK
jgi:4-hydroxy-4-methyl-2-oxoglutarate aldolase